MSGVSAYQPELLYKLAHQVMMATEFVDAGQASEEALLTSADLARVFQVNHDKIKKSLTVLKDWGLLRPQGMSPKRYRFDQYAFRQLQQQVDEGTLDEVLVELIQRLYDS